MKNRGTPYVCHPDIIAKHYAQSGRGAFAGGAYFEGKLTQKGYGIGNILGSLFRSIVPLAKKVLLPSLKKAAKYVGPKLLKTGADIFKDVVIKKKPLKQTIHRRGKARLQDFKQKLENKFEKKIAEMSQPTRRTTHKVRRAKKRKLVHRVKHHSSRHRKRRKKQDIFD